MTDKLDKDKKSTVLFGLITVAVIGILIFVFAGKKEAIKEASGYAMGSFLNQTVYCDEKSDVTDMAMDAVLSLEEKISWRVENSDIYELNEKSGVEPVLLSGDTMNVLDKALYVSGLSNGAFDPTVLPLSSLWNFDGELPCVPSDDKISEFLNKVSYENVALTNSGVFLEKKGMGIDLGAVGKGAACDEAMKIYEKCGVKGAVISVGGSIGIFGRKPDNSKWKVAVRDPNGDIGDALGVLTLSGGCVSTSGSYEKYFEENGKIYHHILDTSTGYPVDTDIISVTVLHESGVMSDALSTACFALGIEKSRDILNETGASALFVNKNNEITVVGNIDFELENGNYTVISGKESES